MKLIKLIGRSTNSWQEAAEDAVLQASKTIRHVKEVHVERFEGLVEDGRIKEYLAEVIVTFDVER